MAVVPCLGWCNQSFRSSDPKRVRFCKKCKKRRDGVEKPRTICYKVRTGRAGLEIEAYAR